MKIEYHFGPVRTRGRNSCSNIWLKGPWPISCKRPKKQRKKILFHHSRWMGSKQVKLHLQVSPSVHQNDQCQALHPANVQIYYLSIGLPSSCKWNWYIRKQTARHILLGRLEDNEHSALQASTPLMNVQTEYVLLQDTPCTQDLKFVCNNFAQYSVLLISKEEFRGTIIIFNGCFEIDDARPPCSGKWQHYL